MKRWLVLIIVCLAGVLAFGYLGQVITSYTSPASTYTRGLAMAAGVLYVVDSNSPGIVYRTNPSTGSVSGWFTLPFNGSPSGLAYTSGGNYLWVGVPSNDFVYRCNASTGSVYGSWSAGHDPSGLAPLGTGDGGAGATQLFTSDNAPPRFYRHYISDGSIVSSITISPSDYDCAYDWRNNLLWIGAGDYIRGYTMSGTVTGSFATPEAADPRGLAYYGSYLYVGCSNNGRIYVVHCPQDFVGIAAASMGRIKSFYR